MEAAEVSGQINAMVEFIKKEAQDKVEELEEKTRQDVIKLKADLQDKERKRFEKDFARKMKQVEAEKRVKRSAAMRDSKMKVLMARDASVRDVFNTAKEALNDICQDKAKYRALLAKLILQGMEKLEEPEVIVLCRKEDEAVAADAVNDAVAKYKSVHSDKQCPKVILDSKRFLPPSSRTATHPPTCAGGVVLSALNGRITLDNTLDTRLDIVRRDRLPEVRAALFGKL